jgi:hypothetical protein
MDKTSAHELIRFQVTGVVDWLQMKWDFPTKLGLERTLQMAAKSIQLIKCDHGEFCPYAHFLQMAVLDVLYRAEKLIGSPEGFGYSYTEMLDELNMLLGRRKNQNER